jgi:hypothetical protein
VAVKQCDVAEVTGSGVAVVQLCSSSSNGGVAGGGSWWIVDERTTVWCGELWCGVVWHMVEEQKGALCG